ncbi:GNAT family N-acyltransferase [Pleionea sediminis]|uniref:GNAT family N-acyltransferase n=1 Tax=Pleionea sediminis TaxID=2569479 RepID=UPI001184EEC6|nr:lysophospholipid acyltransferase family protein [Pleionea sediminis]
MFTVDDFIKKRFPQITEKPVVFKAVTGVLRYLLHEKEFREFEASYPHLDGLDFVESVLDYFNFSYSISHRDRERIPAQGRVVIVSNHPIGSLDGLALIRLVSEIRGDVKIVANEMLMTLKPLHSVMLPVNNMNGKTPKQNFQAINEHLENEGAVIIFPAGEVSRMSFSGVKDGPWRSGFLAMASMAKAPVVPLFVDARNSIAFYLASMVYKPLATVLLVKEMMKQARKTVTVRVGNPIPFSNYDKLPTDKKETSKLFRKHLYRIAANKTPIFETELAIAHPENPTTLYESLNKFPLLGETPDGKLIYLCSELNDSPILREIGRLREISFRAVGEGSGLKRDTDKYDRYYFHLVLWDKEAFEIVGAYRFCSTKKVIETYGKEGLYTHTLFDFQSEMDEYLDEALELGRSFVQPKYWGKRSLDYLWFGIGAFIKQNPHFRYLFGPVSMSDQFPKPAKDLMIYFYKLYFSSKKCAAQSKNPYSLEAETLEALKGNFVGNDYKADFAQLKSLLANMGVSIPTLYKQYSELCEPGGVRFLDFGTDPDFQGCVDGLVLVDIHQLKEKKKKRYLTDK